LRGIQSCVIVTRVKEKAEDPVIATNREARRDYFILETLEAGIVLGGCEVKSLRDRQASLAGSFARVQGDEAVLYNLYIAPYEMGNRENLEPKRERKLLLHRSQINKLKVKTVEKGLVLIPLKLYFNKHGIAKVELAVAKGKKHHDKRSDIKKASAARDIDRAIKNRNRK
jgi:SsrA-binding protein